MGRHDPGTRDFDPALYRVSYWGSHGFRVSNPLSWENAEDEFAKLTGGIGVYAPKVWTERQWQERQAALAHAGKALAS